MKLEFEIEFNNGDTGEKHESEIVLDAPVYIESYAKELLSEATEDTLTTFFQKLAGNPDFDDSPEKGAAYEELWSQFSRIGYESLGWGDVMAEVRSIKIDGTSVALDDEHQEMLADALRFQMSRDEQAMYLIGA